MNRLDFRKEGRPSHHLMVRGGLLMAGVVALGGLAGVAKRARASDPAGVTGDMYRVERRELWDSLQAVSGELAVARLQLERAQAVIEYSAQYHIPADLSAAIYDIALSEGVSPSIGFRLVQVESGFDAHAVSHVGAIGYTQLMPATAQFYMAGVTKKDLYERDINLRIGFRFLRELMDRFDHDMHYALLAYNRGPTTVRRILAEGGDPANGYAKAVAGKGRQAEAK